MYATQAPQLENTFFGAHGLSLFYQAWYPTGTAKAIVALVHGFGEHCYVVGLLVTLSDLLNMLTVNLSCFFTEFFNFLRMKTWYTWFQNF